MYQRIAILFLACITLAICTVFQSCEKQELTTGAAPEPALSMQQVAYVDQNGDPVSLLSENDLLALFAPFYTGGASIGSVALERHGDQFDLVAYGQNAAGYSQLTGLPLQRVIDNLFLEIASSGVAKTRHTCSGAPCSSCEFERSGFGGSGAITGCKCTVAGAGNKCNHSKSTEE